VVALVAAACGIAVLTSSSSAGAAPQQVPAPVAPTVVAISHLRVVPRAVVSGLVSPVLVTSAADGTSRLFVVEQAGRIRVVSGGAVRGTYLDVRSVVASGGERGLLGLAFAPDFVRTRLFWVTYTRADGALVLARFQAASAGAASVAPSTRRTILVVPHPGHANHNGGNIAFGPDGLLYLGTGDGGGAGDPSAHGQSVRTLLGKILRIDVRCPAHAYCIPSTNPYARSTTAKREIWMTGVRNPWRWSFDGATLWIGDVGQDRYEEVTAVRASAQRNANLGWSCREGRHVFNPARCRAGAPYLSPQIELCHPDTVASCPAARAGEAITGGFVYRGRAYPIAAPTYVFADYVTHQIWGYRNGAITAPTTVNGIVGFGLDDEHELYAVSLSGTLYRIGFAKV
jgi:glucose/arabinose dehydrogenase